MKKFECSLRFYNKALYSEPNLYESAMGLCLVNLKLGEFQNALVFV